MYLIQCRELIKHDAGNGMNNDKCRCESKELIDKGMCDKGFIWKPSNCSDKSCYVGKYFDYENCKCTKKELIGQLNLVATSSESFALNLKIYVPSTKKRLFAPL